MDENELPCRSKNDPPSGGGGRSHQGKILIASAVEVQGDGPRRIHLSVIPAVSARSLHAFLGASVAPGAPGVAHEPHVIGPMAAHIVLPWIHRVFANLKTWALGVYHGLRREHIQADLDEFVFRFNRHRTRHAAFGTLLGIGVAIKPVTYKMLITPDACA